MTSPSPSAELPVPQSPWSAPSAPKRTLLYCILFGLVAGAYVVAALLTHRAASLTFPVPSGDEAYFVWQAHAFEQTNTFTAPELDPTRPILLLPFSYQAVLGAVFKVTGCSLDVGRSLSLVLVLVSFVLLAVYAWRTSAPLASVLVIAAFFTSRYFVLMANAIRMEPLLLVILCGVLVLLQRKKDWTAIALLSVSPMVHPNGVLYLAPLLVYLGVARGLFKQKPDRWALLLFLFSAGVWLAHGLYVLEYWNGFIHDTAHRLGESAQGTGKAAMQQFAGTEWLNGPALGLLLAVTARIFRVEVGVLLSLAAGAWLHSHLRIEEPYYPFRVGVHLLLSLAAVAIIARIASAHLNRLRNWTAWVPVIAALCLMVVYWRVRTLNGPFNYLRELRAGDSRVHPAGSYFREEDRTAMRELIHETSPGRPIVVEVYPWADALLFAEMNDARVHYQVPYFDAVVRPPQEWVWGYAPTSYPTADLYIVRASRYFPSHLQHRPEAMIKRAQKKLGIETAEVIRSRDSTEIWYVLRHRGAK